MEASFTAGPVEPLRDRYGVIRQTLGAEIPAGRLEFSSESSTTETIETTTMSDVAVVDTVRVFVRVRPLLGREQKTFATTEGEKEIVTLDYPRTIIFRQPVERNAYFIPGSVVSSAKEHRLTFTGIMGPEVGQTGVYRTVFGDKMSTMDLLDNIVVFSFGTTNAGKTYTMRGNSGDPGLIHRALTDVFKRFQGRLVKDAAVNPMAHDLVWLVGQDQVEARAVQKQQLLRLGKMDVNATQVSHLLEVLSGKQRTEGVENDRMSVLPNGASSKLGVYPYYCVFISYLEIYNGHLLDLFEIPAPQAKGRTFLKIREYKDPKMQKEKLVYVEGLSEIPVDTVEDALTLMQAGINNLHLAETNLNHQSSRSHCVFTIKIVGVDDPVNPTDGLASVLSFCDLAGAERSEKAHTTGDRLTEARRINSSISALMNCLKRLKERDSKMAKAKGTKVVIPFRDTKLTHVLKNFFVAGHVTMLVNVAPCNELLPETLTTLRFSSEATKVALAVFKRQRPGAHGEDRQRGSGASNDSTRPFRDRNEASSTETQFMKNFRRYSEKRAKVRQSFYLPANAVSPIVEDEGAADEAVEMPSSGRSEGPETTTTSVPAVTTTTMTTVTSGREVSSVNNGRCSSVFGSTAAHTASMTIAVSSTTAAGGDRLTPIRGSSVGTSFAGASEFGTPAGDGSQDDENMEEYYMRLSAYWQDCSKAYHAKYLEHKKKALAIEAKTRKEMEEKYKRAMDEMGEKAKRAYIDGKRSAMADREEIDEEEDEEREQVKEELENLRLEKAELEDQLEEARRVMEAQTARIVVLEENEERLSAKLSEACNAAVGQDEDEKKLIQEKERKIKELEEVNVQGMEAFAKLKADFDRIKLERDNFENEVASLGDDLSDVQGELAGVREENAEKEVQLEDLWQQLEEAKLSYADLLTEKEQAANHLKEELSAEYSRQFAANQNLLEQAQKNSRDLEEKLKRFSELEAELKSVQTENSTLSKEKMNLQSEVIDMNKKLREAQASSLHGEKDMAVLREQLKSLTTQNVSLQAQLDRLAPVERELAALKSARKEERLKRDDEIFRIQNLEKTVDSMEKECKSLQVSLKQAVLEKNKVSEELAASEAKLADLTVKLEAAQAELVAIKSKREESPPAAQRAAPSSTRKASSRKKATSKKDQQAASAEKSAASADHLTRGATAAARTLVLPPPVDEANEFVRPETRKRTLRKNEMLHESPESENEAGVAKRTKRLLSVRRKVLDESPSDSPARIDDSPGDRLHSDLRRALQAARHVSPDSAPTVTKRPRGRPKRN